MITKLTKKQSDLIPVVRQEWLDRVFKNKKQIDQEEVKNLIYWLYDFAQAKNKRPKIIFVDSPLGCQYAANMLLNPQQVESQVESQVRSQVRSQVCKD